MPGKKLSMREISLRLTSHPLQTPILRLSSAYYDFSTDLPMLLDKLEYNIAAVRYFGVHHDH